jgi:transcription initiation factor TFIIIB Brf1 subunit/transcription initiation factor TFIIB
MYRLKLKSVCIVVYSLDILNSRMETTMQNDLDFSKLLREISIEKKKQRNMVILKEKPEKQYNDMTDALIDINCRECDSLHIKEIDGFYTCLDCGLRNENVIDCGQDWRYYGNDDNKGNDPARCDMPTNELLPKASMGSFVGYSNKETATSKRIRNMNHWYAMPYKETTLLETFNNITIMAQNSGLNQCVIEEAKYMYKKVSDVKSSRRTKKEGMKAGSISLACKLKGVPRNCTEIAKICHMKNNKTLRKSIKTFEEIWNIIQMREKGIFNNLVELSAIETETDISEDEELTDFEDSDIDTILAHQEKIIDSKNNNTLEILSNTDTIINNNVIVNNSDSDSDIDDKLDDYIAKLHRYISQLGIDDKIFQICKEMLIYVEKKNYLDKHNPLSRIASIVFYANERFKLNINKHQIIQICEVSEVTINKCYQKLMIYSNEINLLTN